MSFIFFTDVSFVFGGVHGGGSQNALAEGLTVAPSYQMQHGRTNANGQPLMAEPYFDAQTPKIVTALVAKSAYLTCRVRNLGNRTVSEFFNIFRKHAYFTLSFYAKRCN